MMERITLAWLAGFFDGEGSISIHKSKQAWRLRITLTQCDLSLLTAIRAKFPEFKFLLPKMKSYGNDGCKRQPGFEIGIAGVKACSVFLETIRPLVVRKLMDVEVGLAFCKTVRPNTNRRQRITPEEHAVRKLLVDKLKYSRLQRSVSEFVH